MRRGRVRPYSRRERCVRRVRGVEHKCAIVREPVAVHVTRDDWRERESRAQVSVEEDSGARTRAHGPQYPLRRELVACVEVAPRPLPFRRVAEGGTIEAEILSATVGVYV